MKQLLGLAVIGFGIYLYFQLKNSGDQLAPGTLTKMTVGTATPSTLYYQGCLKNNYRPPNYKGTVQQWCRFMTNEIR